MKEFTESLRYEYPLSPDSVVVDLGCHLGAFSKIIAEKYGCNVYAFEPVKEFFGKSFSALSGFQRVRLFNVGVGNSTRQEAFHIQGDSSGKFAGSQISETVQIFSLESVLDKVGGDVDLIKLNIEGGEFELLEHMIARNLQGRFKNIQVQFHPVVDGYKERYEVIRSALLNTHRLTYEAPWCWENYERH